MSGRALHGAERGGLAELRDLGDGLVESRAVGRVRTAAA